jgi:transposase
VDDFACRRGHRYATILIDMATHRPIDVLPDREGDTLAAWLVSHPGVEVICRDRAGAYADGAGRGAPEAIHIADRWHLMHNLSEAVKKVVTRYRRCLRPVPDASTEHADMVEPASARPGRRAANTRNRHTDVQELLGQGLTLKAIARQLHLSRATVRRYARASTPEELIGQNPSRLDVLDPFKPYLHQRVTDTGISDSHELYDEIRTRGYRGTLRTLQRFLISARRHRHSPPQSPFPSARQITAWIMRPDHKLSDDDRIGLKQACAQSPEIAILADLAHSFNVLVRTLTSDRLQEWISQATHGPFAEIRSFATGLLSNYDAVVAGLTQRWSSGAVEGQINRVKMIKRQMFGRANLDLLRKRVLTPA